MSNYWKRVSNKAGVNVHSVKECRRLYELYKSVLNPMALLSAFKDVRTMLFYGEMIKTTDVLSNEIIKGLLRGSRR